MTDREKGDGTDSSDNQSQLYERPAGLRGLYSHPMTQVTLLGFVCFMCPGLFNALTGLGAGGQVDPTTNSNANAALYATFAFFAFFAGSINNVLGSRLTLLLGSFGYALYIGSYLAMNIHPDAGGFVIAAGAILGICAGLLWTAQGSLMLAYPTESQKGRFISIFWSIFNLGAVVGASVAVGTNFHSTSNSVGNGTYIGFLVLTIIGVFIPLIMVNPNSMIRTDGTKVTTPRHPSWKTEFIGLVVTLKTDPLIIMLFPMFLASNWFYTWQFNEFNGAIFNIRARSLNSFLYWISQIVGSLFIGYILDMKSVRRRVRAFTGWTILFALVWVVHIWAYFYQKQYTRESLPNTPKLDIYDKPYVGRVFLYIFCGILDSVWQVTSYWIMGAMSNDPAKLAYYSGFYKSLQSAGAAGMWRADAVGLPFMNIFLSTWVLLIAGLVFALPMIHWRVKDQTEGEDELPAADSPVPEKN
ncbi:hypothetical protein D9756_004299 [Leucocoprinus leucothites]|uniref:MFS general substrate transporter n=1 Tax=Leucocoprinus leucothites TaxID=201217 RepID=A0A8H5DAQ7_9AGAR|nr:hypothetical protein D9756_004299 [Leucoagaricus leucothites]